MTTDRDEKILRILLKKVRLLSLEQIAGTWWNGQSSPAERRLRKLSSGGWMIGERLFARPILPLEEPLFSWNPKAPAPDFGRLSWQARSRWRFAAVPTPVWYAAPLAASRLGGHARSSLKNLCQLTHDLHVSELYLRLLRKDEQSALLWVGEDALPEGWFTSFVPDAVLIRRGQILRAVEFGGAYPRRRFESFHEHCDFLGIPYDIW